MVYPAKSRNTLNQLIIGKAEEMGIRSRLLLEGCEDFLELTYRGKSLIINKTRSHRLPLIAGLLAKNKQVTNRLLEQQGLPVPSFLVITEASAEAQQFLAEQGSLVVKPLDASGGAGVTLDVRTEAQLENAIRQAGGEHGGQVMLQRFVPGLDFRVLVINGQVAAVTEYCPAYVIGDGSCSLRELIERLNATRLRRSGSVQIEAFSQIPLDSASLLAALQFQNKTLDEIICAGDKVSVQDTHYAAAVDIREVYADRTSTICPENMAIAIQAANTLNIDVAGIDMRCRDIGKPITLASGGILEVNALPDMTHHAIPYEGASQDVFRLYLEYLFEEVPLAKS